MTKRILNDLQAPPVRDSLAKTRPSLEVFQEIADQAYGEIVIIDENGYLRYVNRKHTQYFGKPAKEHLSELPRTQGGVIH